MSKVNAFFGTQFLGAVKACNASEAKLKNDRDALAEIVHSKGLTAKDLEQSNPDKSKHPDAVRHCWAVVYETKFTAEEMAAFNHPKRKTLSEDKQKLALKVSNTRSTYYDRLVGWIARAEREATTTDGKTGTRKRTTWGQRFFERVKADIKYLKTNEKLPTDFPAVEAIKLLTQLDALGFKASKRTIES